MDDTEMISFTNFSINYHKLFKILSRYHCILPYRKRIQSHLLFVYTPYILIIHSLFVHSAQKNIIAVAVNRLRALLFKVILLPLISCNSTDTTFSGLFP